MGDRFAFRDANGLRASINRDLTAPRSDRPERSNRREVRNPLLGLPAMGQLLALPLESRMAIVAILNDLTADAACRAEASWRKNKGPMAAYWKAVSVYAKHLRAAVRP